MLSVLSDGGLAAPIRGAPMVYGKTPAGPPGYGKTPAGPPGYGKTPVGPSGYGKTPAGPPGYGKTPVGPPGYGKTPAGPPGYSKTPVGPPGYGKTPAGPPGYSKTPATPPGLNEYSSVIPGYNEYSSVIPGEGGPPPAAPSPGFHAAAHGRDNVEVHDAMGRVRSHRRLQDQGHDRESTQEGGTVTYYTARERKSYAVAIGAPMRWAVSGRVMDTQKMFRQLHHSLDGTGKFLGNADWGRSRTGQRLSPPEGYLGSALIWVCAPNEAGEATFYSNGCIVHAVHHSSFSVNKTVIGAGEWVVRDGRLLMISPNSGHFRPDLSTFYNAVLHMSRAFTAETTVVMYDRSVDEYVCRPAREFIQLPSGGGRFKVHVNS